MAGHGGGAQAAKRGRSHGRRGEGFVIVGGGGGGRRRGDVVKESPIDTWRRGGSRGGGGHGLGGKCKLGRGGGKINKKGRRRGEGEGQKIKI